MFGVSKNETFFRIEYTLRLKPGENDIIFNLNPGGKYDKSKLKGTRKNVDKN